MHTRRPRYLRQRCPPDIISHAVWLYHRDGMSFRDVEDLLAERGIIVSYETIRQWCGKFGPDYARQLQRQQGRLGETWFLNEVFVTINGERQSLWRAVDQDGDLIDILVQPRRDARAARRFFRRLLNSQRQEPVRLVTDTLGSDRVAPRDVLPLVTPDTTRDANNRAEVSHQPTRQRERQLRGFTSIRPRAVFLARSRHHSKSVSRGSAPAEIGSASNVAGTSVHSVDRGDGSLISDEPALVCPGLVNLTVPVLVSGKRPLLPAPINRSCRDRPGWVHPESVQGARLVPKLLRRGRGRRRDSNTPPKTARIASAVRMAISEPECPCSVRASWRKDTHGSGGC